MESCANIVCFSPFVKAYSKEKGESIMSSVLLLCFLASSRLVSSGGFAASLSAGGESLEVFGSDGENLISVNAEFGERLSYPSFGDLKLVYISSSRGLIQYDILSDESVVLSEEPTGAPWVSTSGDLWYTNDGFLFKNGISTGMDVQAFSVSVEDDQVAFTDRNDNLHINTLGCESDRTVQGYRFYSPIVLSGGDVIAPTLTGEIIYLASDGSLMVVGKGEQPSWSYNNEGLFYCVSEDDGHTVTQADIWFVKPGGEPVRITDTPNILETRPSCSGNMLWYLNEERGVPEWISLDDLSL